MWHVKHVFSKAKAHNFVVSTTMTVLEIALCNISNFDFFHMYNCQTIYFRKPALFVLFDEKQHNDAFLANLAQINETTVYLMPKTIQITVIASLQLD